ncbi:MAG: glycosyltransferase, partial [Ignavibacteria bacterium]
MMKGAEHKPRLKILYVTAKGGVHDYRFLKKMIEDYDVLLLHYAAGELIEDIKKLNGLRIISKKPLIKSFPPLSELFHFKKIYNQFKPDIVHTGYVWQVGILASLLNMHPHLSMVWGSDILIDPESNFFIRKIVKKVVNQCDHIQCDAE